MYVSTLKVPRGSAESLLAHAFRDFDRNRIHFEHLAEKANIGVAELFAKMVCDTMADSQPFVDGLYKAFGVE